MGWYLSFGEDSVLELFVLMGDGGISSLDCDLLGLVIIAPVRRRWCVPFLLAISSKVFCDRADMLSSSNE